MKAAFTPPPQVAKGDEDAALEEYADALKVFDLADLREAWTGVRDANRRGFWPAIGLLVDAAREARKARAARTPRRDVLNGRVVDGAFQSWGGACQCQRCVSKTSREEFWRAPAEAHAADQKLRRELDDWINYRVEMLPPVQPGEMVAAYRKRCGLEESNSRTAFGDGNFVRMTPEMIAREERLASERNAALARRLASGGVA